IRAISVTPPELLFCNLVGERRSGKFTSSAIVYLSLINFLCHLNSLAGTLSRRNSVIAGTPNFRLEPFPEHCNSVTTFPNSLSATSVPSHSGCQEQHRRCVNQCPTRNFFLNRQEYRHVHNTFTSKNIRRWMAAARLNNNGERCAAALKWEGMARTNDPVAGSHGLYLQAQAEIANLTEVNRNLQDDIALYQGMIEILMPPPPPQDPQQ
ncbi:hypothetical protein A2U01_0004570, partial [Trifolium medium]|nr:hypothetical protein [Trifolium medium]